MLSRSSVALTGGRHVLQQITVASASPRPVRPQARRPYSEGMLDDLDSIPLNLKRARKPTTPDISTALPVVEIKLPEATQVTSRAPREIPTATTFQDIFIPTKHFARQPQDREYKRSNYVSPSASLPDALRLRTELDTTNNPSSDDMTQERPHTDGRYLRSRAERKVLPKRLRIPKAEWLALKSQQTSTPSEQKENKEEEDEELISNEVDESFYEQDINAATNFDGVFEKITSPVQVSTTPQLPIPATPSKPVEHPSLDFSPVVNTAVATNLSAVMEKNKQLRIPNAKLRTVATRAQHLLEANGGDYSRYAGVYNEIGDKRMPTPESLGAVGMAELYLSRQPGAKIQVRMQALSAVRKMTTKRTKRSLVVNAKSIAS